MRDDKDAWSLVGGLAPCAVQNGFDVLCDTTRSGSVNRYPVFVRIRTHAFSALALTSSRLSPCSNLKLLPGSRWNPGIPLFAANGCLSALPKFCSWNSGE